jgi:small conductance mechanosensitive channel
MEKLLNLAYEKGLQLIYALVVLYVGLRVIKYVIKIIEKAFEKTQLDKTVRLFLESLISMILKVALLVTVAGMLGVQTATFVTILGAMGLAIGLALQGSLSNFAGGVLILILKPFQVDDFIEGAGHAGTVRKITIFYTYLTEPDNKEVVIPNGILSNGSVINYSANEMRRVDFVFGVGYESSISEVKAIINRVIEGHELIVDNPAPFVRMSAHADSALEFKVRVWCKASDYWTVHFDLMEQVKEAFDEGNINIPYPHLQVNINNNN